MATITPTDAAYRAIFGGVHLTSHNYYDVAVAVYGTDSTEALEDIDRGRDICDAFERDVAELAYLDLRMHGHDISVRNAPNEFELYSIAAAERLTERTDDDCPW